MNLDFFENFLVLAEEKNISKAADRLFISRSALNRQLLQVETELGQPLFRRLGTSLALTHAGEIYLDMARQVLSITNQGTLLLSDLNSCVRGVLRFGASSSWCTDVLSAVFGSFHEKYPGISITPIQGDSSQLIRMLKDGQLDFAIISSLDVDPVLQIEPLATYEVLLFVPDRHPMAKKSKLIQNGEYAPCSLDWFREDYFCLQGPDSPLYDILWDTFHREKFMPKVILEHSTRHLSLELVRQGIACSFLSDFSPKYDTGIAKFSLNPRLYYSIVLAIPQGYHPTAAGNYFLSLVSQYFKKT